MHSGKRVPVYCHMSRHGLGACGGGGWTLVMKTDGNKVSHDNQLFVFMQEYAYQYIVVYVKDGWECGPLYLHELCEI